MTNLLSLFRRHPDIDALSAHLDSRLDSSAASGLEAHLSSCDACARRLEGLRAAQTALRTMEPVDAPRSFRLRHAEVEAAAKTARTSGRRERVLGLMPAMTVAAVVLLAALVGTDLLGRRGGSSSSDATRALTGLSAEKSAGNSAAAPAPRTADAPAGAAAPTTTQSTGEGDLNTTVATPPPPAAGQAVAPEPSAAGTFPAAASSSTAAEGALADRAETPTNGAAYFDAQAPRASDGGGWSGLRIAEVIVGAVAAGAGAISLARRAARREARG